MRGSEPPALATWLLTRWGSGPSVESLVGDLVEEYRSGRSRRWFWKQALAGIVTTLGQSLREHAALTGRAMVMGTAVVLAFGWLIADPLFDRASRLALEHGLVSIGVLNQYQEMAWMALGSLGFAGSGWMVARFHRPHQTAMVLTYACFTLLWQLPRLCALIVDALGHPRYLPYLSGHVVGMLVTVISTLLGGASASARAVFKSV